MEVLEGEGDRVGRLRCRTKQLLCPLPSCRPPHTTLTEARSYKHIVGDDADRHELLTGGPVQATFTVYEDFMTLGGVYKYVTGRKLDSTRSRWWYGVTENGTEFWSAMNRRARAGVNAAFGSKSANADSRVGCTPASLASRRRATSACSSEI